MEILFGSFYLKNKPGKLDIYTKQWFLYVFIGVPEEFFFLLLLVMAVFIAMQSKTF